MLGPLLYSLYTSPIADIINLHSLQYHLYADDSQLYISFKTDCFADLAQAKSSVELCVKDIEQWMTKNMLKLNQEKTELIVIRILVRIKTGILQRIFVRFIQVVLVTILVRFTTGTLPRIIVRINTEILKRESW